MKKLIIIFLILVVPCFAYADLDTFVGSESIDTFVGSESIDSAVGIVVSGGGVVTACSGSEVFCTSWEDGSDELNTGGDSVFASKAGSPTRSISGNFDGDYGLEITGTNGGYVTTIVGTETDIYFRVAFKISSEPETINTGAYMDLLQLRNTSAYEQFKVSIKEDAGNYDTVYELALQAKTTSTSFVVVGSNYTSLNDDTWYQITGSYLGGTSIALTLYSATGTSLHAWSTSITEDRQINEVRVGPSNNVPMWMDAFSFDTSEVDPL